MKAAVAVAKPIVLAEVVGSLQTLERQLSDLEVTP